MRFVATIAFLMFAAPVLAECPAADVGTGGLSLTNANPYISISYRKTTEGLTETRVTIGAQGPETVVSVYSHPLLVVKRTAGSEVLSLMYSGEANDLNRLEKDKTWKSNVDLHVNGKKVGSGTETIDFEKSSSLSIGNCKYQVWSVKETLSIGGKSPIINIKYYSPKLNTVLRVTWRSETGQVLGDTTFDSIGQLHD